MIYILESLEIIGLQVITFSSYLATCHRMNVNVEISPYSGARHLGVIFRTDRAMCKPSYVSKGLKAAAANQLA